MSPFLPPKHLRAPAGLGLCHTKCSSNRGDWLQPSWKHLTDKIKHLYWMAKLAQASRRSRHEPQSGSLEPPLVPADGIQRHGTLPWPLMCLLLLHDGALSQAVADVRTSRVSTWTRPGYPSGPDWRVAHGPPTKRRALTDENDKFARRCTCSGCTRQSRGDVVDDSPWQVRKKTAVAKAGEQQTDML